MCGFEDLLYKDGKLYRYGKEAGWLGNNGYRSLSVNDKKYLTHRVIWYLHYGTWPKTIDHINQDRLDNRIENLRECTQSVNVHNKDAPQPYNKTSGRRGVHRHSVNNKWIAQITCRGKLRHLGSFDSLDEAEQAYLAAKKECVSNV